MRTHLLLFALSSCLFLGCINSVEQYSDINFNSNSLDQNVTDNNTSNDVSNQSANTGNTICDAVNQVNLLFKSNLGGYYIDATGKVNDASKLPVVKSINSIDEANEFVQSYKLNNNAKNELLAIDYNNYAIKVAYIGFRPFYDYNFNISTVCNNNALTLEVISAPSMGEIVSFWGVFVKIPAQFKNSNILIVDKEVSMEEHNAYPYLPEL